MKIIKLSSSANTITVDTTFYDVDNSELTVDSTSGDTAVYNMLITPREFVEECNLIFYNELTDLTQTVSGSCAEYLSSVAVSFSLPIIKENDSFQVTATKLVTNELLWRGKAFATSQTDLENFSMTKPNINNIIRI
jgi:hypothetical protein